MSADFIHIIAEEMFAAKPPIGESCKIDLTVENPYTWFMALSRTNMIAAFSQFAKLKRISFNKFTDKKGICFYRDKESSFTTNPQTQMFTGPYCVPKKMLEDIIDYRKLRVNAIESSNYFDGKQQFDYKSLGTTNSLGAFCALFLGKKLTIPDPPDETDNLIIDKLTLFESKEALENNIQLIMAIDARELEFDGFTDDIVFDCSPYTSTVVVHRTAKILFKSSFGSAFVSTESNISKFASDFVSLGHFLITTCPNLTLLAFELGNSFDDALIFTDNLHAFYKLMEQFLKMLTIGNPDLCVSIQLTGNCDIAAYEDLPLGEHALFKLGTPVTVEYFDDDPYTIRSVETADAIGRKHKCDLRIFAESPDHSDLYSLGDDYDMSDYSYDNGDDYGDEY